MFLSRIWLTNMITVGVFEAKARLSELLKQVEDGKEVMITRDRKPVARLVGASGALRPAPKTSREELKKICERGLRRMRRRRVTIPDLDAFIEEAMDEL